MNSLTWVLCNTVPLMVCKQSDSCKYTNLCKIYQRFVVDYHKQTLCFTSDHVIVAKHVYYIPFGFKLSGLLYDSADFGSWKLLCRAFFKRLLSMCVCVI